MKLPINMVPGSNPPLFRWRQVVDTPVGKRWIENEGMLPPSVEVAVASLIGIANRLALDNEKLRHINEELAEQVGARSEMSSKQLGAEELSRYNKRNVVQVYPIKKNKGL